MCHFGFVGAVTYYFPSTVLIPILSSEICAVEHVLKLGRRMDVFDKDWSVKDGCREMHVCPYVDSHVLFLDQLVSYYCLENNIHVGTASETNSGHIPPFITRSCKPCTSPPY